MSEYRVRERRGTGDSRRSIAAEMGTRSEKRRDGALREAEHDFGNLLETSGNYFNRSIWPAASRNFCNKNGRFVSLWKPKFAFFDL